MKEKSDWKKITLLRKTSCKKGDQKYWPLINGYPEIMAEVAIGPDTVTGEVGTSHHFSDF